MKKPKWLKTKINIKKVVRKTRQILYGIIIAILVITAGLVAISALNIPGNYKLLSVQSGSMEPSIKRGALVIVKPANDYKKGDIITASEPANPKVSLTHRIVEVKEKDGKISYITKGDANKSPDSEERPKENVLGKTIFSIPYLGFLISFAKTQTGFIFLVIVPATLIIYSELISIKNEAVKLLKERKKRKLTQKEELEVEAVEEEIKIERGLKRLWHKIFNKKNA